MILVGMARIEKSAQVVSQLKSPERALSNKRRVKPFDLIIVEIEALKGC
jgi:hypothetical protein